MRTNDPQNDHSQLWQTYQASFEQFAKEAFLVSSAMNSELNSEPDELQTLALEEARAAYSRARDAVALSLMETSEPERCPGECLNYACA